MGGLFQITSMDIFSTICNSLFKSIHIVPRQKKESVQAEYLPFRAHNPCKLRVSDSCNSKTKIVMMISRITSVKAINLSLYIFNFPFDHLDGSNLMMCSNLKSVPASCLAISHSVFPNNFYFEVSKFYVNLRFAYTLCFTR